MARLELHTSANELIRRISALNPELDILHADFHREEVRETLQWGGDPPREEDFAVLMHYQRLLRIDMPVGTADKLIGAGLTSAHAIAAIPEPRFTREYADLFDDNASALEVHRRATDMRARVRQLALSVHGLVSPHYRGTLSYNASPELVEYFEDLPGYQDLFGSLNYCSCPHCRSLFSPAAYFLDIMRITDEYITYVNTHDTATPIPPEFLLETRRPDLFDDIKLNCADTDTVVPYLTIVNNILKQRIEDDGGTDDAYQAVALAPYPFNLPFNLPLEQIRLYLGELKTTFADILASLLVPQPSLPGVKALDVAREFLGLSIEEYNLLITPVTSSAGLGAMYGYDDIQQHLPYAGDGQITVTQGQTGVTGTNTKFKTQVSEGDQIRVGTQVRTVATVSSDTQLTVLSGWTSTVSTPSDYTVEPAEGLMRVQVFLRRTGLQREQLEALLNQELDEKEWLAGIANSFFINNTGEGLDAMHIVFDKADPDVQYSRIEGLSVKRLDRLSRFIRLSAFLGWTYANVNWSFTVFGAGEITQTLIASLAQMQKLCVGTGQPADVVASFWYAMKTIGRVDAARPLDLFDRVFNNPALLDGQNPYDTSKAPIPFDPARPLKWNVVERTGQSGVIRSRLLGALLVSDNDLTLVTRYLMDVLGISGDELEMTLDNLSWLYRLTKMPSLLMMTVDEYIRLLYLVFCPAQPYAGQPVCAGIAASIASPDGVMLIRSAAEWVQRSPFTVYDLQYITTGMRTDYVDPGYTEDSILPFVRNLATLAEDARVGPSAFTFEDIDAADSARIRTVLIEQGFLSDIGIVLDKTVSFDTIRFLFPFTESSFKTDNIGEDASRQVFQQLKAHGILVDSGALTVLSSAFDDKTDLGFLFTSAGSGQATYITAYNGMTKIAAVYPDWTTAPDATSLYRIETMPTEGTAQAGSRNTITLAANTSVDNNAYKGMLVEIYAGRGAGQIRLVTAYTGATHIAEVETDWTTAPDATSQYRIITPVVTTGAIAGAGPLSATLAQTASSLGNGYNGMQLKITAGKGEGQFRIISAYDGTTKVATVDAPWDTEPDTTSQYSVVLVDYTGHATAGTISSITLDATASSVTDAYVNLVVEIIDDPRAELKRGEVKNILLQVRSDINHTVDVLMAATKLQDNNVIDGLAGFLSTKSDMIAAMLPFAANACDMSDLRAAFLTPIPEGGTLPPHVSPLIALLARGLMLANYLRLTPEEIAGITSNPAPFTPGDTIRLTLATVREIAAYTKLEIAFQDSKHLLLAYFDDKSADLPKRLRQLSAITGWQEAQIAALIAVFWPEGGGPYPNDYTTVAGIVRLKQVFDLSAQTGVDVFSLLQLVRLASTAAVGTAQGGSSANIVLATSASGNDGAYIGLQVAITGGTGNGQTRTITAYTGSSRTATVDVSWTTAPDSTSQYNVSGLALAGTSGAIIQENWALYTTLAGTTLDAVNARYEDVEFSEIFRRITDTLNTLKRDALLGYAVWIMNKTLAFIDKPSDLYQYLLIDVEMSGCADTTPIVEGIAAVQLYMQRCRMNLEPGVTRIPIPDVWWQWMSAYRVWEVNRKIFLYPENYVEPTLRQSQTSAFRQLAESLLQTNIDEATVENAYKNYFDDFSILANLVNVDSFNGVISDPDTGESVPMTILFGRTNTDPYTYFYRRYSPITGQWAPWEQIELTINSPLITPAYVFNRLFIFWVETTKQEVTTFKDGSDSKTLAYIATIKYSFFNHLGQWAPEQILTDNFVVDFIPTDYNVGGYVDPTLINPAREFWHKAYAMRVPAKVVSTDPLVEYPERVVVMLGAVYRLPDNDIDVPAQPTPDGLDPYAFRFREAIYQTSMRAQGTVDKGNTRPGFIVMNTVDLVGPTLMAESPHMIFLDYNTDFGDPQPYRPAVNLSTDTLMVIGSTNVLYDNYYGEFVDTDSTAPGDPTLLYNINQRKARAVPVRNQPGWFIYNNGDEQFLLIADDPNLRTLTDTLVELNYSVSGKPDEFDVQFRAYTTSQITRANLKFKMYRLSTFTIDELSNRLFAGGVSRLLTLESQLAPELPVQRYYKKGTTSLPSIILPTDVEQFNRLDFNGSYGEYFWEIFFYSPFLVFDRLNAAHRFEEAKRWLEYIFNPTQQDDSTANHKNDRYWRFLPFRGLTPESLTEILTNPAQIAAFNNDPFDPDAIARLRPTAYPKAVVMRYIDNLIDWGDFLFSIDTRESITQATNLYVMASDMLGPRPQMLGECAVPPSKTFNQIKAEYDKPVTTGTAQGGGANTIVLAAGPATPDGIYNQMTIDITAGTGNGQSRIIKAYNGTTRTAVVDWDWKTIPDATSQYRINGAIPEFLIQLENTHFAYAGSSSVIYSDVPFNDINSYFCIPENSELMAYWDTVEDRLYKIRHCMNIHGVERSLALFAPPLNPRDLIRAAASGGDGIRLASQIEPQVPNYRFAAVIETAKSLTSNVIQLGGALLSALEKQDAEELALLMNAQQAALLALTTQIKQDQIEQTEDMGTSLLESRAGAQERYRYYATLIAKGLSPGELQNLQAMEAALMFNLLASITRTASSIGYAVPNVGSPFAMTYGGAQIGNMLNAASGVFELGSMVSGFVAERSLTMAGYERRAEDWGLQVKLADYDTKQIDAQIDANNVQLKIAKRELEVHMKSIEQTAEVEAFLRGKFTNKELYQWMASRISTVYFQTYSIAFELARSAQRAYQFELNTNKTFVNFGYWDNLRRGLLAGEGLMLALNQMEKSYIDSNVRTLEIERTISLLQLNPKALLDLKTKGECTFELTEKLFDYDFPGHYARKIKSIAITIPAVVGPYQGVRATLTQLGNQIVLTDNIDAVNFLLGGSSAAAPGPDHLRSNWWINQQIAISQGVNDAGVFELNFRDERYLPFEGTGAVSSWRFSMPKATNRINFDTISDVVITLRYTSRDGGEAFRRQVTSLPALKPYSGAVYMALAQQFSQQWYAFMTDHSNEHTQTLRVPMPPLVPPHVQKARLVGLYFRLDLAPDVTLTPGNPFITLQVTDKISVEVRLGPNNDFSYVLPSPPLMEDVVGSRAVVFNLDKTPAELKVDGYLNPVVLRNIGLIFYYSGSVDWA